MSPLWNFRRNKSNSTTKQQNPSPNKISSHAHDITWPLIRSIRYLFFQMAESIKGIWVSAFSSRKMTAGMTVEASLVLPLFLFFFLNLSSAIEIIRLHGNLEAALRETGNNMSIYGYALSDEEKLQKRASDRDKWWYELADMAFSYSYIRQKVVEYAGWGYLDSSPLTYGADGLQFIGSNIFSEPDRLDIVLTYQISPLCSAPGFRSFLMENHYYGHLWTGYEIPGTEEYRVGSSVRYYVAENGEVYHKTRECTHLKLTRKKVSLAEALKFCNLQGERYSPCQKCRTYKKAEEVWISETGEHYHYRENCPGLKRTIYTITEKETRGYRPCMRCVGRL